MQSLPGTEYNDELMLAAVKRALAGVSLDPNHDVQDFAISESAGFNDFGDMSPVAAYVLNGAVLRYPTTIAQRARQEVDIFRGETFRLMQRRIPDAWYVLAH